MSNPIKVISDEEKKKAIESALYYLTTSQPFMGSLLQELTLKYSSALPTAAISFNPKTEGYEVYLNPEFFCSLDKQGRVAVLHHEILHFTNKHLFRLPFIEAKEEKRKLYNIAGDMAINQFITGLPKGCVDVKEWKMKDKTGNVVPFPELENIETYYELIKNNQDTNEQMMKGYKEFDRHEFILDENGNLTDGEGNPVQISDELKEKMLEQAKKVLKRTIEKTSFSQSNVPDSIKDLLQEIETLCSGINAKQILKNAIKRTVCMSDREGTWKRPNKRYGGFAPGTKLGALPKLAYFVDTSGSISHIELNQSLQLLSNFLKVGARQCTLGLWHTSLYYRKKYKLHSEIAQDEYQTGGTDVTEALQEIARTRPDLSIIFTDGYISKVDNVKLSGLELIWIISENGNMDHPMRHVGKTLSYKSLKN